VLAWQPALAGARGRRRSRLGEAGGELDWRHDAEHGVAATTSAATTSAGGVMA